MAAAAVQVDCGALLSQGRCLRWDHPAGTQTISVVAGEMKAER
jgi:hypothetical protein